MGLEILAKIPWKEIGKFSPLILDVAMKINKAVQKRFTGGKSKENETNTINNSKEYLDRINQLEENEIEQAQLVQNMASQLNTLSDVIKILSKRIYLAYVLSGISILASIVVIVLKTQ